MTTWTAELNSTKQNTNTNNYNASENRPLLSICNSFLSLESSVKFLERGTLSESKVPRLSAGSPKASEGVSSARSPFVVAATRRHRFAFSISDAVISQAVRLALWAGKGGDG